MINAGIRAYSGFVTALSKLTRKGEPDNAMQEVTITAPAYSTLKREPETVTAPEIIIDETSEPTCLNDIFEALNEQNNRNCVHKW